MRLPLNQLSFASYNPEERTRDNAALRELAESIKRVGVIVPIIVSADGTIIDGHRRAQASHMAGLTDIPVVTSSLCPEMIYAEVNATMRRHTGNEILQVFSVNENAVHGKYKKVATQMKESLRDEFDFLIKSGFSPSNYKFTMKFCGLINDRSPETVTKVCKWVMKHHAHRLLRNALEQGVNPMHIYQKLVLKDKPLRPRWML